MNSQENNAPRICTAGLLLALLGLVGCATSAGGARSTGAGSTAGAKWVPRVERPPTWSPADTKRSLTQVATFLRGALPPTATLSVLPVQNDTLATLEAPAIVRALGPALAAKPGPRLATDAASASHALAFELCSTDIAAPTHQQAVVFMLFASVLDLSTGRWLASTATTLRLIARAPAGIKDPMAQQYTHVRLLGPTERPDVGPALDDLDQREFVRKAIDALQLRLRKLPGKTLLRIYPHRSRSSYKFSLPMLRGLLRRTALQRKGPTLHLLAGPQWAAAARKVVGERAQKWPGASHLLGGWLMSSSEGPALVKSTLTLSLHEIAEPPLVKMLFSHTIAKRLQRP